MRFFWIFSKNYYFQDSSSMDVLPTRGPLIRTGTSNSINKSPTSAGSVAIIKHYSEPWSGPESSQNNTPINLTPRSKAKRMKVGSKKKHHHGHRMHERGRKANLLHAAQSLGGGSGGLDVSGNILYHLSPLSNAPKNGMSDTEHGARSIAAGILGPKDKKRSQSPKLFSSGGADDLTPRSVNFVEAQLVESMPPEPKFDTSSLVHESLTDNFDRDRLTSQARGPTLDRLIAQAHTEVTNWGSAIDRLKFKVLKKVFIIRLNLEKCFFPKKKIPIFLLRYEV